jgi:mannose-6-phosphate isomerase
MLKLNCKAQNYAWGKKGMDSLVGQIYSKDHPGEDIGDQCFAEFWMGDHPNGPSQVLMDQENVALKSLLNDDQFISENQGKNVPLPQLLDRYPQQLLGQAYLDKFIPSAITSNTLTYLFKVLSIRTALSIQAHPHKELAAKLHAQFPDKYKDPNHKPEIAIALKDDFVACYGFASPDQIKVNLQQNPALAENFPFPEGVDFAQSLEANVTKMFLELDTDERKEERTAIITAVQDNILKNVAEGDRSEHQKLCL